MAAQDLTTLANVKQYLGVTVTTDDALLTRLITSASAWIQSYLNRTFALGSFTDVVDGNGSQRLILGNYPIQSLVSVYCREDGGTAVDPSILVFDSTSITLVDPLSTIPTLAYRRRWPLGKSNITVNYTAGYATTPMDIEEACIEIVALRYREKGRVGTQTMNTKGESVTFSIMDVPTNVKTLLKNWRNVVPA